MVIVTAFLDDEDDHEAEEVVRCGKKALLRSFYHRCYPDQNSLLAFNESDADSWFAIGKVRQIPFFYVGLAKIWPRPKEGTLDVFTYTYDHFHLFDIEDLFLSIHLLGTPVEIKHGAGLRRSVARRTEDEHEGW